MGPQFNYHLLMAHRIHTHRCISRPAAWQIPKVWKQISLKITGCSHHQPVTTNQWGDLCLTMSHMSSPKFFGGSLSYRVASFVSIHFNYADQRKTIRNVPLVTQFIILAVNIHSFQSAVVTGSWFFATHLKKICSWKWESFYPRIKKAHLFQSTTQAIYCNLPPKANVFSTWKYLEHRDSSWKNPSFLGVALQPRVFFQGMQKKNNTFPNGQASTSPALLSHKSLG